MGVVEAPVEGAGASQLLARLQAKDTTTAPKKARAIGPEVIQTAEGKVLSGSLTIETRADLKQLEDVVRLGGDLTVQEGALKNTDLLPLRELRTVEGRLTFEGMRSC